MRRRDDDGDDEDDDETTRRRRTTIAIADARGAKAADRAGTHYVQYDLPGHDG
jgi:hypothetical protein